MTTDDQAKKHLRIDGHKSLLILLVVAGCLFLLFYIGVFSRHHEKKVTDHHAMENPLPSVTILVAKPEDKPLHFLLPSVTQANHVTPIWARADGYIKTLLVDIGDVVKKDQHLVELDTPDLDQKYLQALQQYNDAVAQRDVSKLLAERGKKAMKLDIGAISQEDLDQRLANYNEAKANCKSFEANMNYYKELMEFKYVVAPFDGIIIERDVDVGSLITSGSNGSPQQLFVIAATDIMRLFVSVPQNFFRQIHEGLEGTTTIREFGTKTFTSKVARFAKALDPIAHTMLTELHIDNKNGELLAGLYADVTFVFKPDLPYFIVPTPAVIIREGDPKIAVIDENDIVQIKTVKIGLDFGKSLEIIDGISPGDKIITNPTEKIKHGVMVKK